jgi:hypothetical protein
MKTAMQELIDEVRRLRKNGFSVDDKYLQGLLEKEKEQIKNAWYNGGINGMGLFEINTGEEYYNQTYKTETI